MSLTEESYQIADELRAIASTGLLWTDSHYDRERYERILAASARLIGALEQRPATEILARFQDNLFHISPLTGVEVVVIQNEKVALVQRRDDKLWALPGGLAEIGETLAGAAQRELREETGIRGKITRLLGIFDSRQWQTRTKVQLYSVIFQAEIESGIPTPSPETLDVDFFDESSLPALSQGHHLRVPFVFKILRGQVSVPYFDIPNHE
jgi:ADP-ribose pyrophosphatase YjhB (NUDIX family)